ncbi:MAG TPA: hypothetical protein VK550_29425 [Polyangiaceae bacterium]|nr:hypothetical protein [Polyangiaceae bacterium]
MVLRNRALAAELETAVARRSYTALFAMLRRLSGLPGPRANDLLAWAFGEEVARAGARADDLIAELCAMSPARAPAGTDSEFLPVVGAACIGARLVEGPNVMLLDQLRLLAEDPRHLVREGVCRALVEASRARSDGFADDLSAWTDGYLGAAVALEALTVRTWLDRAKSAATVLSRLEESFDLAERAPRSDQRSQGYRLLVKLLPQAAARLLDRFPEATLAWLESKAVTRDVALRAALSEVLQKAGARGHGARSLEKLGQALDASAPPRRDPRTYVGPTRKRGARRH